mmetsp:Transcript_16834/g.56527  ORF Transcript_16834/g.56527 Transcript_16834/m.56527 type:complete len:354 (-) Transcript_16834:4-1065(-)
MAVSHSARAAYPTARPHAGPLRPAGELRGGLASRAMPLPCARSLPERVDERHEGRLVGVDLAQAHEQVDDDEYHVGLPALGLVGDGDEHLVQGHGPEEVHLSVVGHRLDAIRDREVVAEDRVALDAPAGLVHGGVGYHARRAGEGRHLRGERGLLPALLADAVGRQLAVLEAAGDHVVQQAWVGGLAGGPLGHPEGRVPVQAVHVAAVAPDAEERHGRALHEDCGLRVKISLCRPELVAPALEHGHVPGPPQVLEHLPDDRRPVLQGAACALKHDRVVADIKGRFIACEHLRRLGQHDPDGGAAHHEGAAAAGEHLATAVARGDVLEKPRDHGPLGDHAEEAHPRRDERGGHV